MANAHSFRKKEKKKIFTEIIFFFVKEKPQQREKLFSETILKDPIMYSYVSLWTVKCIIHKFIFQFKYYSYTVGRKVVMKIRTSMLQYTQIAGSHIYV